MLVCALIAFPQLGQLWLYWSRHATPEHARQHADRNASRCTISFNGGLTASRHSPYERQKLGPTDPSVVLLTDPSLRNSLCVIKHQPKPYQFQPLAVSGTQDCGLFACQPLGQHWPYWSRDVALPEHAREHVVWNADRCTETIDSGLADWLSRHSPFEGSHAEFGSILPAAAMGLTQEESLEQQQQKQ
jgi:hypothetical protein